MKLKNHNGIFVFIIKPNCSVRMYKPMRLNKFRTRFDNVLQDSLILVVSQRNCHQTEKDLPPSIGNHLTGINFISDPFYGVFRKNCCGGDEELLTMGNQTNVQLKIRKLIP